MRMSLGLAVTTIVVAIGAANAAPMSGTEVETLLKGKTFNAEDWGGTGTTTWGADGVISTNVTKPDGSVVQDTGTYRFDGTGYCSQWAVLRTTEKCFLIEDAGGGNYNVLNTDGSLDSKISAQ